mgnify:CR=1 FL=1
MQPARALAAALEPFVGQVYFSPECHANYEALGFAPSRGQANGVALPDGPAYFTSRGSLMGQVPGELVAAAFAVFNPEAVVLGGDLSAAFDPLASGVKETLYPRTSELATRRLRLLPSTHGDRAGLVGCAALALDHALAPAAVDARVLALG